LELRLAVQEADRSSPHVVADLIRLLFLLLLRRLLALVPSALRGTALGRVAVLAGTQARIPLLERRHAHREIVLERLDVARTVID